MMLIRFNFPAYEAGRRFAKGDVTDKLSDEDAQRLCSTAANKYGMTVASEVTEAELEEVVVEEEDDLVEWPLDMSPEEYLEKYPDGPSAELARNFVEELDEDDEKE